MNYFIIAAILALFIFGCYECITLQEKSDSDAQRISDFGGSIIALQAQNKKIEEDELALKNAMADLAGRMQATQSSIAEVKKRALETPVAAKSPITAKVPVVPKAPPASNDLGTITTLDGRTFDDCHLLKVEANVIVFTDSDGIMELAYNAMQPELQKRFGYDPKSGPSLPSAQVQVEEDQREAANQASGSDY